jgi:hypothetical protein
VKETILTVAIENELGSVKQKSREIYLVSPSREDGSRLFCKDGCESDVFITQ